MDNFNTVYNKTLKAHQPSLLNEGGSAKLIKYIPQIWNWIKSNPEIIEKIVQAIPEIAGLFQKSAPAPEAQPNNPQGVPPNYMAGRKSTGTSGTSYQPANPKMTQAAKDSLPAI